jgi:DNA-binding response OmpR family regulator
MKLLLVEDEARVAAFIIKGLKAQGYVVTHVTTGEDALAHMAAQDVDLIILDLGLPDIDGTEVLGRLRKDGTQAPVIVLTARAGVEDRVEGLNLGADDYLTKPFAFDELVARVRARLRRPGGQPDSILQAGRIQIDLRTRRAWDGDRMVELTAREFAVLESFMRHPGQVLSREQLLSQVWGMDFDPNSNVVEVYIRSLRRKLGDDCIETVRGVGYRLLGR